MRNFKKDINFKALEHDYIEPKQFETDEANEIMHMAKEVLNVFRKYDTDMEIAYLVLTSLADAIYVSSVYGFEDDIK